MEQVARRSKRSREEGGHINTADAALLGLVTRHLPVPRARRFRAARLGQGAQLRLSIHLRQSLVIWPLFECDESGSKHHSLLHRLDEVARCG